MTHFNQFTFIFDRSSDPQQMQLCILQRKIVKTKYNQITLCIAWQIEFVALFLFTLCCGSHRKQQMSFSARVHTHTSMGMDISLSFSLYSFQFSPVFLFHTVSVNSIFNGLSILSTKSLCSFSLSCSLLSIDAITLNAKTNFHFVWGDFNERVFILSEKSIFTQNVV